MENNEIKLKGIERRKKVRKFMDQGISQVEIADKLQVDVTTISEDVQIIRDEYVQYKLSYKRLIEKDTEATLETLSELKKVEQEIWKIYEENVKDGVDGNGQPLFKPLDAKTRLDALDKVSQITQKRAQLLKLLNPAQISIERLVIAKDVYNVTAIKIIDSCISYVPEEKRIEFLKKISELQKEIEGDYFGK